MSTAALASARRRRTTNEPQVPPQNANIKLTQQESQKQQMPPPQSLTPLQILQIHDNKIKELETLIIEFNSEDYITNVVDEKINELIQAKLSTLSTNTTNTTNNNLESKLLQYETNMQKNLTVQNVRIDEFKNGLQENFNTFKENINKMVDILNVKENNSLSNNASVPIMIDSKSSVERLDMLTADVNELKSLLIKNQTLSLEASISMLAMKDELKSNNEKIEQLVDKIGDLNNRQCGAAQCDPAQMFLQSFMKTKLFGGANNMTSDANYEDEYEDDNELDGANMYNTKKLHIDLTNEEIILDEQEIISDDDKINLHTNELIIDENQLQEILELNSMEEVDLTSSSLKQEVLDEIKNISALAVENNLELVNEEASGVVESN